MIPAHQRFETGHPTGRKVNLGLIVHGKAEVPVNRMSQVARQRDLVLNGVAHPRLEEAEPTAALLLGAIQGKIGVALQVVQVGAMLRDQRDADAGTDADLAALELDGAGDGGVHGLGQTPDLGNVQIAWQNDRELVATEAAEKMTAIHHARDHVRDLRKQFVTRGVSE